MKATWIVKEEKPDILLFFNGWGMDDRIAAFISSSEPGVCTHDVLAFHDYSDLNLPSGFSHVLDPYRSVDLVAWSLGVWAAIRAGIPKVDRAVAVNGTPDPVDDRLGIPLAIFQATLDRYSEDTRRRFERRMLGEEPGERFARVASRRTTADQEEELRSILQAISGNAPVSRSSWTYGEAVVGGRDLVFPVRNQYNAWDGIPKRTIASMPHFPFFLLSGWKELIA
jgi:biotin synthesis protein BioG